MRLKQWRDGEAVGKKKWLDQMNGKRRRQQDKVEWKKNVLATINFDYSGPLISSNYLSLAADRNTEMHFLVSDRRGTTGDFFLCVCAPTPTWRTCATYIFCYSERDIGYKTRVQTL